jgi:hypothetical protein
MNVQQLIEELQKYPPEMRVIVEGYEGGYSDLEKVCVEPIQLNVHGEDRWYFGRHDDANYPHALLHGKRRSVVNALLLPRP